MGKILGKVRKLGSLNSLKEKSRWHFLVLAYLRVWAKDADFPLIDDRHYVVHCRYVKMAAHLPLVHAAESRQVHFNPEGGFLFVRLFD